MNSSQVDGKCERKGGVIKDLCIVQHWRKEQGTGLEVTSKLRTTKRLITIAWPLPRWAGCIRTKINKST